MDGVQTMEATMRGTATAVEETHLGLCKDDDDDICLTKAELVTLNCYLSLIESYLYV